MNIQELRELHGISQTELAKQLGVVRSTICQYEKGNRQPDTATLLKLADFFGVTVDYLLGRKDETPASVHAPTTSEHTEAERELLTLQTVRSWAGKAGKPGEVNIQKKA